MFVVHARARIEIVRLGRTRVYYTIVIDQQLLGRSFPLVRQRRMEAQRNTETSLSSG